MDLIDIYHLIETEFKVVRAKDIICVAPVSEENYPETTVKLCFNKVSNQYELFKVVRGNEYKVEVFLEEYQSILALYIFSKSKLEVRNYDVNVQSEIESAKSFEHIQRIFKTYSDKKYYSLLGIKTGRVVLEKSTSDRFNVLFLGRNDSKTYIDKSRKLNSAAVVLYNFSIRLSQLYELMDKIEVKMDSDFIVILTELYLLG